MDNLNIETIHVWTQNTAECLLFYQTKAHSKTALPISLFLLKSGKWISQYNKVSLS